MFSLEKDREKRRYSLKDESSISWSSTVNRKTRRRKRNERERERERENKRTERKGEKSTLAHFIVLEQQKKKSLADENIWISLSFQIMTLINTTNSFNLSTSSYDSVNWLLEFSLWPLRIVCPILIIFCPIANWTCICIFQSRLYCRSSSKWYFICIAIFDTIYVLVTAPLIFLLTLHIYILNWHVLLCKSLVFLNYLSCQISAGLLACLSIDRLIATSCLLVYRYHCTANLSKYVCIMVILIFSIVNSHYLIGYTIDSNGHCSMRHYSWYEKNYSRLNVVYLLSYSIIPFTIIAICNICIVISVCQSKSTIKKKYSMKKSPLSAHSPSDIPTNSGIQCRLAPISSEIKEEKPSLKYSLTIRDHKHKMSVSIDRHQVIHKLLPETGEYPIIIFSINREFFIFSRSSTSNE